MTFLTAVDGCAYCGKPSDDLITYSDGASICLACRRREQQRYEQATGRCARGCAIAPAYHTDPDRCPEEHEARAMAGDR